MIKNRNTLDKGLDIMGGIVAKYVPKCYAFDEQELNRILFFASFTGCGEKKFNVN